MFLQCLWCLSAYKSFNFNITKYISPFCFAYALCILKILSILRLICCSIFLNKILKICFSDWDLYSSYNLFLCMMSNKNLILFSHGYSSQLFSLMTSCNTHTQVSIQLCYPFVSSPLIQYVPLSVTSY